MTRAEFETELRALIERARAPRDLPLYALVAVLNEERAEVEMDMENGHEF